MSTCQISLLYSPRALDLDDLDGSPLDVFFATGIVNPFGPTLTVVAAVGVADLGKEIPVVEIMLNPFRQEVLQIGTMLVGTEWHPEDDLAPLIERDYGGCPTLVLVTNKVSQSTRIDLTRQIFESYGSKIKSVAKAVETHLGDPWARVDREIRGSDFDIDDVSVHDTAMNLASLVLSVEHIVPELQAMLAAWQGSIEKTGVSDQLKWSSMSHEHFRTFIVDRVFPTIWLPEIKRQTIPQPELKAPEKLEWNSIDDITQILNTKEWQRFSEEKLVSLLRLVLYMYGSTGASEFIEPLSGIYKRLLHLGADEDTRLMIEAEMVSLVQGGKVHALVFLPFLIEDPSQQVASKAVIDFVSMSEIANGALYAFTELRMLIESKSLTNRGAVFGGLVAIGDSQSVKFASELRGLLDSTEVKIAARVHTPFPQHKAIQFWLQWAKELVYSQKAEDQKNFGSAASALILVLTQSSSGEIIESDRNYPCHKSDPPTLRLRTWSREEYAEFIAPDLYWLESQEDSPSLFSDVLRHWGLMPRASVDKQFIGDSPALNKRLRDLSETEPAKDGGGFLSRLFGKRRG
jgi:hypothetical protein